MFSLCVDGRHEVDGRTVDVVVSLFVAFLLFFAFVLMEGVK